MPPLILIPSSSVIFLGTSTSCPGLTATRESHSMNCVPFLRGLDVFPRTSSLQQHKNKNGQDKHASLSPRSPLDQCGHHIHTTKVTPPITATITTTYHINATQPFHCLRTPVKEERKVCVKHGVTRTLG
ncbi:hypothetical protein E2C01_050962 [Portunus trituberculatus]|uniref:Uncharacterized protein n=1 Tax=Portunus trituberculatus TaxID=210409 RepID=A0A5B7GKD8_PORTR|nr:hypothetical protein [Portunus trituberculatus]